LVLTWYQLILQNRQLKKEGINNLIWDFQLSDQFLNTVEHLWKMTTCLQRQAWILPMWKHYSNITSNNSHLWNTTNLLGSQGRSLYSGLTVVRGHSNNTWHFRGVGWGSKNVTRQHYGIFLLSLFLNLMLRPPLSHLSMTFWGIVHISYQHYFILNKWLTQRGKGVWYITPHTPRQIFKKLINKNAIKVTQKAESPDNFVWKALNPTDFGKNMSYSLPWIFSPCPSMFSAND
jgi:hypothetical protein